MPTFHNWNGSQQCSPSKIYYPRTTREIQDIVQKAYQDGKRIRVVGKAVHTYGSISMCDKDDVILNLQNYDNILAINKEKKTVTAQAGIALEELIPKLEKDNVRLALRNMGEITEQSLGGVIATGTHGSGGGGPNGQPDSFSDQITKIRIMECSEKATIHIIRRDSPEFAAFQTHLGALGIVLDATLQLVDWYHLEWKVEEVGNFHELTIDDIRRRYNEVYSLSYTYFPTSDEVVEVSRVKTTNNHESGLGADIKDDFVSTLRQGASRVLGVFPSGIPKYQKFQKKALLTLKGSDTWRKVLSQGDLWGGFNLAILTDAEYAVPMSKTIQALGKIREILTKSGYSRSVVCVVGIRFVKATSALLACHYSSKPDDVFSFLNVQYGTKKPDLQIVDRIQSEIMALGGRPHWGKYNTTTKELIRKHHLWPSQNLQHFLQVKAKYDRKNLLGNAYLDKALITDGGTETATSRSLLWNHHKVQNSGDAGVRKTKEIEIETSSF